MTQNAGEVKDTPPAQFVFESHVQASSLIFRHPAVVKRLHELDYSRLLFWTQP